MVKNMKKTYIKNNINEKLFDNKIDINKEDVINKNMTTGPECL